MREQRFAVGRDGSVEPSDPGDPRAGGNAGSHQRPLAWIRG